MRNFPVRLMLCFLLLSAMMLMATEREKYWLFFKDKGPDNQKLALQKAADQLDERVKWRRAKVMDASLVDYTDLPVYTDYIAQVEKLGYKIAVVSKWLNGISLYASADEARRLAELPFVDQVQPVLRGLRKPDPIEPEILAKPKGAADTPLDYGESIIQNEMIHVPDVHGAGFTGRGVRIAVFDTGFRLENESLQHIDVIAAHDFINDDDNVDNEDGDYPTQNSHGTAVLSIVGGYAPGHLIGPAFSAGYLLAKTEDVADETQVEEDYWIAAAEWAEGLGADIITSSLGYLDWYNYEDMNGQTAKITLAADLAVQKGVVVVTSAGNEGDGSWYYITAPADGFDVIAVGAVLSTGGIAGFSSRGPTSDGRIKPEVVAMGVQNVHARVGTGFSTGSGTSYSCPLVAGAAALILSAHPELTPRQVRQALIQTADRKTTPDNTYGFGLINALAAANYWGTISDPAEHNDVAAIYPNPFSYSAHNELVFSLDLDSFSPVTIELYNILGQRYGAVVNTSLPGSKAYPLRWNGLTAAGERLPSGIYFYRARIGDFVKTGKITLLQ